MLNNIYAQKHLKTLLDDDKKVSDVFILLGELNIVIISSTIKIIANKLESLGYSKSIVTKSKLIAIELLENISKHQLKTNSLNPYFELSIEESCLKFVTGNCISNETSNYLSQTLDEYSAMTPENIKAKYFEKFKNNIITEQGNAGLGLLTIFKRAKKQYEYKINIISANETFFNSIVKIDL